MAGARSTHVVMVVARIVQVLQTLMLLKKAGITTRVYFFLLDPHRDEDEPLPTMTTSSP